MVTSFLGLKVRPSLLIHEFLGPVRPAGSPFVPKNSRLRSGTSARVFRLTVRVVPPICLPWSSIAARGSLVRAGRSGRRKSSWHWWRRHSDRPLPDWRLLLAISNLPPVPSLHRQSITGSPIAPVPRSSFRGASAGGAAAAAAPSGRSPPGCRSCRAAAARPARPTLPAHRISPSGRLLAGLHLVLRPASGGRAPSGPCPRPGTPPASARRRPAGGASGGRTAGRGSNLRRR